MICHCNAEAGECCVAYRVFLWVYCGSILLLFALAFVLVPSTDPLRGLAVAIQPLGEAGTSGATLPPSLNAPSALFVPHHGGNLSGSIDGTSLRADAQSKASQVSRYLRMTLADLPPPVGQSSRAQLTLHIENDQSGFGIGPVFVGPRAVIRGIAAQHQHFINLVQALIPTVLAFGLVASFFLIFFSSTPLRYFYFLLCMAFNILFEFEPSMHVLGMPLRPFISYLGNAYLLTLFNTGSHWWNGSRAERRVAALGAVAITVGLAALDMSFGLDAPQSNIPRILAFALPAMLVAAISLVRGLKSLRHTGMLGQSAIAFATLVYTAFLLNLVRLYLPTDTMTLFTVHFLTKAMGALAIVGLAGSALAYEYGAYRAARRQVATLSAISAGHHLALDEQARALKSEIERLAVLEERQRFTRDMHDGIGGQLLSMLLKARSGAIDAKAMESDISHSINDLRLITASLDAADGDLHDALAGFGVRVADQAKAAGLTLYWDVAGEARQIVLPPRATLELLRVMQEAVTNAIRHAGASRIAISVGLLSAEKRLSIRVSDDGIGLPEKLTERRGAGIRNMSDRAERLGGLLEIGAGAAGKGSCVMLTLPCPVVIEGFNQ
jgi:signal transduction histidine kinase